MTSLLAFWFVIVALTGAGLLVVAELVLEVGRDRPSRRQGYRPPASHHLDDFARTGSSYR